MKNPFIMSLAFCRIVCRLTHHKWGRAKPYQEWIPVGDGDADLREEWFKRCLRCGETREVKPRKKHE